jgi:hypothetical protein
MASQLRKTVNEDRFLARTSSIMAVDTVAAAAVLGVAVGVPEEELRRAWRILALRYHPDKNTGDAVAAQKFREATDAYKLLSTKDGFDCSRSYEQLSADNDDARVALARAMELNKKLMQDGPVTTSTNRSERLLKIGESTWVGAVEAGRPHGDGDLILPNGSVHSGSFKDGRASGPGMLYDLSGSVMAGSWVENKRVGSFVTTDPKGGEWADVYDQDGKRTSRKKLAPPPANAVAPAQPCRHCGVKVFFGKEALRNPRCRQHSGKWLEASTHNADGSAAVVDRAAFPEGGMWLCCGSKSKDGAAERCTLGEHAAKVVAPVPEERRIAPDIVATQKPAAGRRPSFIESSFTTKVEYDAWALTLDDAP